MLTLGFHNPFAVLGKEASPKRETRGSAQGASYPGVLRRALSPKSPPRHARPPSFASPPKVTQDASQSDADGTPRQAAADDDMPMLEAGTPLKAFLNALVNAEAAVAAADGAPRRPQPRSPPKPHAGGRRSALKSPENPRPRKRQRVTFASQELSTLQFTPPPDEPAADDGDPIADLLDHLSVALDSADAVRAAIGGGDGPTQRSVARVAAALGEEQTSCGADRRAARAAAFLRDAVAELADNRASSALETRHAEVLSSLVRRELKLLLNDAVAIVQGTGSVRFNFDDPAALLHRALRALEDGGGPAWARRRAPQATASEEEARGVLGLAAAHGFALSVLTQSSVRAKLAAGDFERLERLCARIRGPVDASLSALAAAGAAVATPASASDTDDKAQRPASPASQAVGRAAAAAAARLSQEEKPDEEAAAPAVSPEEELPPPPAPVHAPPTLPSVSQSPPKAPESPAPDSPTSAAAASPTLSPTLSPRPLPRFHASAPPPLACLAPLKDAHALKCALLACAPDAHAAAADAIARLSGLRDAREAEAAARSRKKKKRKRPKPLFDELAAAGVFLYPEIGAFDAE